MAEGSGGITSHISRLESSNPALLVSSQQNQSAPQIDSNSTIAQWWVAGVTSQQYMDLDADTHRLLSRTMLRFKQKL